MDPLALALVELGAVVFCLGLLARLAGRIGMSPIPLYFVGGLAFGAGGFVKLDGMHGSPIFPVKSASYSSCLCSDWNIQHQSS